jgi:hypothetical protein
VRYIPPSLLLLLDKVFICTSLAGSLAWIADYSRRKWWRNPVGRTLMAKTVIIAALLSLSALQLFFNLNRYDSIAVAWLGVALLGLIGPVMVWRMAVFHRVSRPAARCANGHPLPMLARYCPQCGVAAPEAERRAD